MTDSTDSTARPLKVLVYSDDSDTREQVAKINGVAHQVREAVGAVTDGVVTASGERIGIADKIATRRNDRDADVANRENW
ncbi:MAG: hypothetical protein L0K86_04670, partial [Actinomycetia bacterium]|nr:hypothetical protein [Actinomycetes bacterium]